MGLLADTIRIYEELCQYSYTVKVENGLEFSFSFLPENYHHLAGFQHIADVIGIAAPRYGSDRFYRLAKMGRSMKRLLPPARTFIGSRTG